MICPISKTLCESPKCYINSGIHTPPNAGFISCEKADKDSIYFLDKYGKITKLRTKEKKK